MTSEVKKSKFLEILQISHEGSTEQLLCGGFLNIFYFDLQMTSEVKKSKFLEMLQNSTLTLIGSAEGHTGPTC